MKQGKQGYAQLIASVVLAMLLLAGCAPQSQDALRDTDAGLEGIEIPEGKIYAVEDGQELPGQESPGSEPQAETPEDELPEKPGGTGPGHVLAGTATPYLDFTKEEYDRALAEGKIILLNFYAGWCPLCRAEQPEAFAAFDELENPDVIGFRVNYNDADTDRDEQALAKQFGITYQHTKVILRDGEQVVKDLRSWDRDEYLSQIGNVAG